MERVSCVCWLRFGRFFAHPRDDSTEEKRDACSDKRDYGSLDLKQGKVAEDEGVSDGRDVKIAHVGCGSKTSRKIHFYIAFEVKDDGDYSN